MSLPSTRRDTSAAFVANVSRQSRTERRVPLREGAASMEILIEGLDVPSYVADIAERKRHSFVACRLPEVAVFGALLGAAYAAVRKRERHVETVGGGDDGAEGRLSQMNEARLDDLRGGRGREGTEHERVEVRRAPAEVDAS